MDRQDGTDDSITYLTPKVSIQCKPLPRRTLVARLMPRFFPTDTFAPLGLTIHGLLAF